jgi:glucoamylase
VWFTISRGILTEIYYPTIDRPQIRDAQLLITDGETFFHEEKRDLITKVERIEADALGYRTTAGDPAGRYTLEKEVISDPHQSCVLVHAKMTIAPAWRGKLHAYVLLAPHLEVGGWGNSAQQLDAAGRHVLIAWKNNTCLALGCNHSFVRSSCGFVGQSDGWQDLNDNFKMDWEFERAENGNVAIMGELDLSNGTEFTVGIAFGDGPHAATAILTQSLAIPFSQHRARFVDQWERIASSLHCLEDVSGDQGRLYRTSRNLLHSHEDKTFAGALIASASIPWGDAMGDEDLGGYHLVWTRDMVNSATALLACGDHVTPLRALIYLACSQQPDGGFPQNFWIDGTPYWKGVQLDEVAFPIMLAWRLWKEDALEEFDPWPMVKAAASYLIQNGPITQQERWEEASGYSPSTLAACIAGLICAADFARVYGEDHAAGFIEDFADFIESHVETWTVTSRGTLLKEVQRHYIRIQPIQSADKSPVENANAGMITLANRPPEGPYQFPAREIVDAGFLELVRYGIRGAGSRLMEDSLRVVDAVLKVNTPFGASWLRYNHDGYGPHEDGKPFTGWGRGRPWPLLTGERAHYELAAGRDVRPLMRAMENFASMSGMLPEQVWDHPDLPEAGMFLGKPCGAAMPLMWAHAEYIKLLRSLYDGKIFDLIQPVGQRYLNSNGRSDLEIWKTSRQPNEVAAGKVLRVQLRGKFCLRWEFGEKDTHEAKSGSSVLGFTFVDIPLPAAQSGSIRITFLEADEAYLIGTTYDIKIMV